MRIFRRNNKVYVSLSERKIELLDISEMPTDKFLQLSKKELIDLGVDAIKNKKVVA